MSLEPSSVVMDSNPRTLTFLFTDIEGSTRRWEADRDAMSAALARHDAILRRAIESQGGTVFKTVGDAFCAVFVDPVAALRAALEAQRALGAEDWRVFGGDGSESRDAAAGRGPAAALPSVDDAVTEVHLAAIRVRMALHSGLSELRDGDFFGPTLNRVARLLAAGHGGQVLISQAAEQLLRDALPVDLSLIDLGEHRLKDLSRSEHIWQLAAEGLQPDFRPLATLDARPNNLPVQLSAIVGREAELATIQDLLGSGGCRLVTLTGPGGTGKTRLALHAAAELLERYTDGVWLVDLSPVTEPAQVLSALAEAVGVRELPSEPLSRTLARQLQAKRLLLLVDNCEQVLDAVPDLGALLTSCPQLTILATSRAPLRLAGERELPLEPLALPEASAMSVAALQGFAAVQLFVQRAMEARPDFVVTTGNAAAVAEICRRLDGLPLAIELAAARVRSLTPEAMLGRLGERLRILTGGARDLPARQQTMRAAIAWSHDLLDGPDRLLLRRLTVFVQSWTLEAAESVCAGDDLEAWEVLDSLQRLVEHSLVRRQDGAGGSLRYGMLETIREFAAERLVESGEGDAMRARHLEWCVAVAASAVPEIVSEGSRNWTLLNVEVANLLGAARWGLESTPQRQRLALALLARLDWTISKMPAHDIWQIYRRAIPIAQALPDVVEGAHVVYSAVGFPILRGLVSSGDGVDAELLGDLSIADELFAAHGYERGRSWVSQSRGSLFMLRGDPVTAQRHFEEALDRKRAADAPAYDLAITLNWLGEACHSSGDYSGAETWYQQAITTFPPRGEFESVWPLINLGQLAYETGLGHTSATTLVEALDIIAPIDPYLTTLCLAGMAGAALLLGHLRPSARWFAAAQRSMADLQSSPQPLAARAWAAIETGLREALSASDLADAAAEGARLPLAEAVAEAMSWGRGIAGQAGGGS